MSAWLHVVSHPDVQNLDSAGEATAIALGFGLFAWWRLLRVHLKTHLPAQPHLEAPDERFAEVRRIADAQLSGGQPL
ncbi:hypothetical protein [Streptomyces sp. NPDC003015]